jgi:SecD/SecF fusion protein
MKSRSGSVLSLKGGMSLVLEIAQDDVLRRQSENSKDPAFNLAINKAKAKAAVGGSADFMTLFAESYQEVAPDGKLAAIFATLPKYQKTLTFSSTNDQVITVLRAKVKDQSMLPIRHSRRVSTSSVWHRLLSRFSLMRAVSYWSCLVCRRFTSRMRRILQQTAQLEFWDTYENEELYYDI